MSEIDYAALTEKYAKKIMAIMKAIEPFVYGCPCHPSSTTHKECIDKIVKIVYETD